MTWACLVAIGDVHGCVTFRAFRGSQFNNIAKHSQIDLVVNGGPPPGGCSRQLARKYALSKVSAARVSSPAGGDALVLHRWAVCLSLPLPSQCLPPPWSLAVGAFEQLR